MNGQTPRKWHAGSVHAALSRLEQAREVLAEMGVEMGVELNQRQMKRAADKDATGFTDALTPELVRAFHPLIVAARLSWLAVRSSGFMAPVKIQSWWISSPRKNSISRQL